MKNLLFAAKYYFDYLYFTFKGKVFLKKKKTLDSGYLIGM